MDAKISPESLKHVQRPVLGKDGKPVMEGSGAAAKPKMRAIAAKEVLAFAETEAAVTVVTRDGQKFRGAKS